MIVCIVTMNVLTRSSCLFFTCLCSNLWGAQVSRLNEMNWLLHLSLLFRNRFSPFSISPLTWDNNQQDGNATVGDLLDAFHGILFCALGVSIVKTLCLLCKINHSHAGHEKWIPLPEIMEAKIAWKRCGALCKFIVTNGVRYIYIPSLLIS